MVFIRRLCEFEKAKVFFTFFFLFVCAFAGQLDVKKTLVWGPGLDARVTLPVRYFYIQPVDEAGNNITKPLPDDQSFKIKITSNNDWTRTWQEVLNNHDGSYSVRYRHYNSYDDQSIEIKVGNRHVGMSPYVTDAPVYHEQCNCPEPDLDVWFSAMQCPPTFAQLERDLQRFPIIDMATDINTIFRKFSQRGAHSLVHYTIYNNKIYARTRGKHVDFKMFSDAVLTSLTRKVHLPDVEFVMNLGDWPLERLRSSPSSGPPLPIVSWCGSTDTADIVIPTYEMTESVMEMLGRVSLDVFSVVNATGQPWSERQDRAFFRGRDSSEERIKLVKLSREHPDLIDARLTHIFFFRDREEEIGELVKRVSFFDFFKYKYQISMDGTVAAYRFPLLMAGNSLIFKQDSKYYEHFYRRVLSNSIQCY